MPSVLHGTVRGVEAVPTGRRVTLDAVRIEGAAEPLHRRLRVRLKAGDATPVTSGDRGQRARAAPAGLAARLSRAPGTCSATRSISDLAGTGYALGPIVRAPTTRPIGPMLWMLRLRETINRRIDAVLTGGVGRAWRRRCSAG